MAYTTVGNKAMVVNAKAARNLPRTTSPLRIGMQVSNSIVPLLRSSATRRMVIAGARITSSMVGEKGVGVNKVLRSARPIKNSVLKNIQPATRRNETITI